jgi:GTP-binding protein Era
VSILGRPNAGKSTLMNALLGAKISIIAARAQTTRSRILGILTRPDAQILFYDTPGVHRGRARFNRAMTEAAIGAGEDADVRVVLFEAGSVWDDPEETLAGLPSPLLLVRTKRDLAGPTAVPRPERFDEILEVSARTGEGLDALAERIVAHLPEGPALYPDDALTDRPVRFLAAEQIREVAFEIFDQELPYSIAIEVEEWKETDNEVKIRANVLVERESHKGIVVGSGGQMLKRLGTQSRHRLIALLGKPTHLNLWVKTDRNWTRKPRRLRELGYL